MNRFAKVSGPAAALPMSNIDTDVIMPKAFLKGIERSGLARGLFHDLRFDQEKRARPDFVLNRERWRRARFLVVGPNFGCGSSREHAVWGLMEFGIQALIGTSFAGIFFDNCRNNGLLAITLDAGAVAEVMAAATDPDSNVMTVDLETQTIEILHHARLLPFAIDARRRQALLTGRDPVVLTLEDTDAILVFERKYLRENPWVA